jgi:hypothetical protein
MHDERLPSIGFADPLRFIDPRFEPHDPLFDREDPLFDPDVPAPRRRRRRKRAAVDPLTAVIE